MTKPDLVRTHYAASILLALTLVGCTTPGAKDFGGAWKPVNHFQKETTEIPLEQAYRFYASPMDGTLKTMLTRWAKDTSMKLSYQLTSDFTLYQPVSKIQTSDVRSAAAELSRIYAEENVQVTINDKQILVSVVEVPKTDAPEEAPATDAGEQKLSANAAEPTTSTSSATPTSTAIAPPTAVSPAALNASTASDAAPAPATSATPSASAGSEP